MARDTDCMGVKVVARQSALDRLPVRIALGILFLALIALVMIAGAYYAGFDAIV